MATRTNPLVSAAVLASTAAIAVATPAIAPSVQLPSPHALQAAKVQLTTFSDLLSITATDWSNVLFGGYGEAISPNQDPNFDWAAAYISPFTRCDFSCKVNGPSGIAYLALDALLNGNGTGYAPVYDSKGDPIAGYPTWSVSSVNYFFEGGPGPGTAYLVAQPFGDPKSPLYNPAVASIITQAFNGLANVTTFYVAGLTTLATLAKQIPAIGPYIYGAINAYLGPQTSDPKFGDWGYAAGLSGILRYVTDVITTGGNPLPPYGPQTSSAAATLAAAAALAPAASVVEAPKAEAAPASRSAKDAAPAPEVKVSAPADTKADNAPAVAEVKVSAPVESKPVVTEVKDSAPAVDTAPANKPAVEVKVPEAPSVPDVAPSAPAAPEATGPSSQEIKNIEKEIAKTEKEIAKADATSSASTAGSAGGSSAGVSESNAVSSGASEATSGASAASSGPSSEAKTGASSDAAGSATDSGDSAK